MPLFINACLHCFIHCQFASWLMLRIASLPNTSCDSVCCIVVCTLGRMANIVNNRFLSSKSISWILKVSITLLIVWCTLSTIAFLLLMSFAIIVFISAKSSLPLFIIIKLDRGYLVNQNASTRLGTRSAQESIIEKFSIKLVAGSIMIITCKNVSMSFLPFMAYFQPPLLGAIIYLPIRSIHSLFHGWISACLADSLL